MPLPASFLPVLQQLNARLPGETLLWAITGSTAFALRGLPFTPNDIDLQTDAANAYAVANLLQEFVVQPVTFSGTDRIRSHFGQVQMNGVKVEIMGDVEKWVNGSLDKLNDVEQPGTGFWEPPPNLAQHREFVQLDGMALPVLSLAYECKAYEKMGRLETAVILQQWLEKQEQTSDR